MPLVDNSGVGNDRDGVAAAFPVEVARSGDWSQRGGLEINRSDYILK